jgi:hypothetical protein
MRLLARNQAEVRKARASIERIGKLADNLIGVGPVRIGLDGMLTWIPIVGAAYSLGAGAALIAAGVRARAPIGALAKVAAIVLARSGIGEAPIAGQIAVDLFRGHKWAADILTRAIDQTLYVEGAKDPTGPQYAAATATARMDHAKRRVVFLG